MEIELTFIEPGIWTVSCPGCGQPVMLVCDPKGSISIQPNPPRARPRVVRKALGGP